MQIKIITAADKIWDKSIDFDRFHVVSECKNLYEKYGFEVIDRKMASWGKEERIDMRQII